MFRLHSSLKLFCLKCRLVEHVVVRSNLLKLIPVAKVVHCCSGCFRMFLDSSMFFSLC